MMDECCANCEHCHELWYWKETEYPKNKQYGYACTALYDMGEDVVMQIFQQDDSTCEMFAARMDGDE